MLDIALQQLLAPVVTALGYELVGVERIGQGRHSTLLRVTIDHAQGITLDDCERVSYQVSGVLDVEDPIHGQYTLEVSSPGLDRPLFTLAHFKQFLGHSATIRLRRPLNARRVFTGQLQQVDGNNVIIDIDGTRYQLPFEQIEKARLVPVLLGKSTNDKKQ